MIRRLAGVVVLLLAGPTAARAQEVRVITEGMTHQEVINAFGHAYSTRITGDVLHLYYRNRCRPACADDVVILKADRVVSANLSSTERRLQNRVAQSLVQPKPDARVAPIGSEPKQASAEHAPPPATPAQYASEEAEDRSRSAASHAGGKKKAKDSDQAEKRSQNSRRLSIHSSISGILDSNLYRSEDAVLAQGTIAAGGVRFRSSPSRPAFQLHYEAAFHSYQQAEEWNRLSHSFRTSLAHQIGSNVTIEAAGEASIKGTSEDRELGDLYVISPRMEFRMSRANRLRLIGAYRLKRLQDATAPDEGNRYAEVEFRQKIDEQRWQVEYRIEANESANPRREYKRWTFGTGYNTRIGAQDEVAVGIKYRAQTYPGRVLEIKKTDVPRQDHRWIPSLSWMHSFPLGFATIMEYRFETRSSNDPGKRYDAHMFTVTAKHAW